MEPVKISDLNVVGPQWLVDGSLHEASHSVKCSSAGFGGPEHPVSLQSMI